MITHQQKGRRKIPVLMKKRGTDLKRFPNIVRKDRNS